MLKHKLFYKLVILSALILAGCGESFRGQSATESSNTNTTNNYFDNNGLRNSLTDLTLDQQAALLYRSELEGKESATQAITNTIKAFDLALTVNNSGTSYTVDARITLGCNNYVEFSRAVTPAELQSLRPIDIGTVNNYRVRVQCTSISCSELVVALSNGNGIFGGTVLVGMGVGSRNNNTVQYLSRNVAYRPYFTTYYSSAQFSTTNNCPQPPESLRDRLFGLVTDRVNDFVVEETIDFLERLFR